MRTQAKKRKPLHRLPSDRQFLPAINERDLFKRIIRTHQLIEKALVRGIVKRLVEPGALEMSTIPFPLKVNLAIALGMLPPVYGPPLLKVNAMRNAFAHNPATRVTPEKAMDLWNCVPPYTQQSLRETFRRKFSLDPRSIINMVFGVMFLDVKSLARRKSTEKYQSIPYFNAVSISTSPP